MARSTVFVLALALSVMVLSDRITAGATPLIAQDAWIPEAPPTATAVAGYGTLTNNGSVELVLTGAESPHFSSIELHRSVLENGIAKMIPQSSMRIAPGGRLELEPGGLHLMMMKPTRPVSAGEAVEVTLQFDDGTSAAVSFQVRKRNGDAPDPHHHH